MSASGSANDLPADRPRRSAAKLARRIMWLAASGLTCGVIAAIWLAREPTQPLTAESLRAARERWRSGGIRDYQMDVRVGSEAYRVDVSGGEVTSLRRLDGQPVTSHDLQSYSVDGWFEVLERDLELRDDPGSPLGSASGNTLLRVRFNSRYGYVERYVRSIPGGRSQVVHVQSLRPGGN